MEGHRSRSHLSLVETLGFPATGHQKKKSVPRGEAAQVATTPSAWGHWVAAFVQRLRELGWIEGRTVAIVALGDQGAHNYWDWAISP
jgi:hypothetical protein